ncbi:PspC family transcriptional regulator [Putridiphycobacter roseus]|uniref:PspC family transcriptional regulator n=1 Tax=Putridiphycobacter roseus TaxID=2219161 RepID=A0A2W1NNF1_9FLAO|nr:PspC family transcriptional regulator [Putridiphycobacter roseus]
MQKIAFFFELRSFGVSTWFANKLGVRVTKVRLFFIYASFIGLGSPLILYLIMAFILENKHIFKFQRKAKTIWEL